MFGSVVHTGCELCQGSLARHALYLHNELNRSNTLPRMDHKNLRLEEPWEVSRHELVEKFWGTIRIIL